MKKSYWIAFSILFTTIVANAQTFSLIKDIFPGSEGGFVEMQYNQNSTVAFNNILIFSARDMPDNYELWKSDGTAAGTVKIKEIIPGNSGSYPKSFTIVN